MMVSMSKKNSLAGVAADKTTKTNHIFRKETKTARAAETRGRKRRTRDYEKPEFNRPIARAHVLSHRKRLPITKLIKNWREESESGNRKKKKKNVSKSSYCREKEPTALSREQWYEFRFVVILNRTRIDSSERARANTFFKSSIVCFSSRSIVYWTALLRKPHSRVSVFKRTIPSFFTLIFIFLLRVRSRLTKQNSA